MTALRLDYQSYLSLVLEGPLLLCPADSPRHVMVHQLKGLVNLLLGAAWYNTWLLICVTPKVFLVYFLALLSTQVAVTQAYLSVTCVFCVLLWSILASAQDHRTCTFKSGLNVCA